MERRLTAILAADMVGYSRLMGSDEAGTLKALKSIQTDFIKGKIVEHQGRVVKVMGDGMLVEFPRVNAVACAVQLQCGMQERNVNVPKNRRIEFRIGVNLGDVIAEGEDIFGDGVNVAVRLGSLAKPGGIAISGSVRDHVGNRLDLVFEDIGEQRLKNIEKPIRVYNVAVQNSGGANTGAARSKLERPSIAVLPFNNMSGDPEQEYFSDGITEDLITDLSKISGLFVVSRHTAFTYKGTAANVQHVAQELGVEFVLEGSVRKAGASVRITGQLINSKDGHHLWAERFDRDLTDVFGIQDEITHAIVEQLRIKLLPQEKKSIEQVPTENIDAYTYYLRGQRLSAPANETLPQLAQRMFTRAAELDSSYARAYAGIADCDSYLYMTYHMDVPIDGILATAEKALALDPNLAEAHAARGVALAAGKRYEEAEAEFEKAIALNPNSFEAYTFYARACFAQGNIERAGALFERDGEINPEDYQAPILLIQIYKSLGREKDRKRVARRGVELAERELTRHPENSRPAQLGAAALFELGETERSREWTVRALAIDPEDPVAQYNAACSYTRLGDIEGALDLLERCFPNLGH